MRIPRWATWGSQPRLRFAVLRSRVAGPAHRRREARGADADGGSHTWHAGSGPLHHGAVRPLRLFVLLAGLALLGACGIKPRYGERWTGAAAYPFAPVSVRLHPLTHIEPGPDGALILVCYVELLDRFGDGVKGVGTVTVDLVRPGETADPDQPRVYWNVDLADMEVNTRTFDRATRLYRFQLGGLPEWAGESPRPRSSVRVVMAATGPEGREVYMEDALELGR